MYYFFRVRYDAKFLSRKKRHKCPRCGLEVHSDDKEAPPWKHYGTTRITRGRTKPPMAK